MIGAAYLDYPLRRRGADQDRSPMRYLRDAAPVTWPGGAPVALWVTVPVQFFPINMGKTPFVPPGGIEKPYPSHWDFTVRDYGNRVGIFRLMRALDAAGIRATAPMNAAVATRYPALLAEIVGRDWEVMASGTDMGELISGEMPEAEERGIVESSIETLRAASGQPVTGWHSPAHSESFRTLDLVAERGIGYVTDWVNDDMPDRLRTESGEIVSLPISWFLSDQFLLQQQLQRVEEFEHHVLAALDCLKAEAERTGGGRILSLSLTPWLMGQPYRIAAAERLIGRILAGGGVWPATGREIVAAWSAASPATTAARSA